MGMGVVLDVESEKVEKYPSDMPVCGEAFASDVYRKDTDDVDESFSFGEIMMIVMAVIAAVIVVLIFLYKYLSTKGSNPMAGLANSPLHDVDRQL